MGAMSIQQMADRVAALMEERLSLRGQGLAAKLARGGRRLPRQVREAASRLADAAAKAPNPKLLVQLDEARVAADFDLCLRHLNGVSRWERRKAALLSVAGSIAISLVAVALLAVAFAYWRGLI